MSINRAISPRVLRSSRTLLLALFSIVAIVPVWAAPQSDVAILATGPSIGYGLPFIQANSVEYYGATYTATARSKEPVKVFYAATPIPPSAKWSTLQCSGYSFRFVSTDPPVLLFSNADQWSTLLVFPKGFSGPCRFAGLFLTRFFYFLGITHDTPLSSFPAVLQLGG